MTPRAKQKWDKLITIVSNWKTIAGAISTAILIIGSTADGYIKSVAEPLIDSAIVEQTELYQIIIEDQHEQNRKYLARSFARFEMSQNGCEDHKKGMKNARKCKQLENEIAAEYLTMMKGE